MRGANRMPDERSGVPARAGRAVVRNRLHLVLAAFVIWWAWPPWFDVSPAPRTLLPVLLAGFGLYQLNRIADVVEDSVNDPVGYREAMTHRTTIKRLSISALGASILLSLVYAGIAPSVVLAAAVSVGVFYSFSPFGISQSAPRLKEAGILKNVAPSLVWPIVAVIYPALMAPASAIPLVAMAAAVTMVAVFTIEVAWDVRDAEGDRLAGVRTLANRVGAPAAMRVPLGFASMVAVGVVLLIAVSALDAAWLIPAGLLLGAGLVAYFASGLLEADRAWSHLLVGGNILAALVIGVSGRAML